MNDEEILRRVNRPRPSPKETRAFWLIFAAILLMFGALCMFGCASPAQRVLRSVNDYEYHNARQHEDCAVTTVFTETACAIRGGVLRKWSDALDEAGAALKRGGAFPLQLNRLKTVEKEMPK